MVDNGLIHNVNVLSRSISWKAHNYTEFWGRKYTEGLQLRLGTFEPIRRVKSQTKLSNRAERLPQKFNSVDHWPGLISDVVDQGWCGSSWAVSTASVASDRFGIQSKGKETTTLSAQNIISCARRQQGCKGGHLDAAWQFFRRQG